MKEHFKQILISLKLMLNGSYRLRKDAFLEWKHNITSANLADDPSSIPFIPDPIADEFGWAEMTLMRDRFQQASKSAQSLAMRLSDEARKQEYLAARQSLQTIPSSKAICVIWNEQVARWRKELSVIKDSQDASV